MLTIDKFLFRYSLEQGGDVIGWIVLILSMMAVYLNSYLLVASWLATPSFYTIEGLNKKFNYFNPFLDLISVMIVFLVIMGVSAIVLSLLLQPVEAVS